MSSDAGGDGWEGRQWDDMVERCAAVVDRLRTNNDIRRADDEDDRGAAELTRALEEIVALIADDEEYVPALGAACGHDLLARLVTHRVPEVASAAADAMEACARHCPPGASFPARGDVDEPSHAIMRVGTLAAPLTLRMRHVREGYGGGERRRIPNIAWDSGLVLARWISRHPELVAGKSVLEIGAGLGAPSMAAARRGASTVALTDADPLATRNAAYNARMNLGRVASAKLACVVHDWNDESDLSDTDSDDSDETNHGTDRGRATCSLGRTLERFGGFRRSDEEGGGDSANGGGANEVETSRHEVETSRRFATFDVVLGADVVHERGMAQGVARMLGRHLGRSPDAVAVIVNPAPAHRSGAADLPSALESNGMAFASTRVTSAMLRVGVMEETEDVRLDMFLVRRREWGAPDASVMEDVTDEWVRHA